MSKEKMSLLESALVNVLNKNTDAAKEQFHAFVIETAREINESLREADDADFENFDVALEEEFFTENDLTDEDAVDNLTDDLGDADLGDAEGLDADLGVEGDLDADLGGEVEGDLDADLGDAEGEGDIADKIESLEDDLEKFQAELEQLIADLSDGEDAGEEIEADAELVDGEEEEEASEEDFDDINESIIDDLKKVNVPNVDGVGADGKKLAEKGASPVAKDAKPSHPESKNKVGHTGFARETAPAVKAGPDRGRKYDNNRAKATDGNAPVAATGPKKAELSKAVAGKGKSVIDGSSKK